LRVIKKKKKKNQVVNSRIVFQGELFQEAQWRAGHHAASLLLFVITLQPRVE